MPWGFSPQRQHISKGVAPLKDMRTKTVEALYMVHHNMEFGQGDKLLRKEWEQKWFDTQFPGGRVLSF